MFKLCRYLKRYWLYILAIVGLLYLNAQTELALPDYMSDIISVGIQPGGIEDSVVDAMDQTTYEHLSILLEPKDQSTFQQAYTLSEGENDQYPLASQIYVLSD